MNDNKVLVSEKQRSFLLKNKDELHLTEEKINDMTKKEGTKIIKDFLAEKNKNNKIPSKNYNNPNQKNNQDISEILKRGFNAIFKVVSENEEKELEKLDEINENIKNLVILYGLQNKRTFNSRKKGSIYFDKSKNRWVYSVYQNENGTKKRKYFRFKTKQEALDKRNEVTKGDK